MMDPQRVSNAYKKLAEINKSPLPKINIYDRERHPKKDEPSFKEVFDQESKKKSKH